jgi:hypothetical protein
MMAGRDSGIVSQPGSAPSASILFPDSGYVAMRSPHDVAILDAGPHGFLNGGHAHADALSMTLTVNSRPLLIDPGTATYVMDPVLRDRFRATAMHNTVVVDGRSQSIPAGPFHWKHRTDARLLEWKSSPRCDYLEAEHDGYRPTMHRRVVIRIDDLWIVTDLLAGEGEVTADAFWHLDPAWRLTASDAVSSYIAEVDGDRMLIASTGDTSEILLGDQHGLGWSAPIYGQLMPSPTIRFTRRATLPFCIVTAVTRAGSVPGTGVGILPDDGSRCCTVRITYKDENYLLSLQPSDDGRASRARLGRKVPYEGNSFYTDGRAAVLHLSPDQVPISLHLIGGSAFEWIGPGSFELHDVAMDLHLDAVALRQLQR